MMQIDCSRNVCPAWDHCSGRRKLKAIGLVVARCEWGEELTMVMRADASAPAVMERYRSRVSEPDA